ncbi:MAG: TIGR01212 family radical SAM protein [Paludibacteraceae bacterium]|nr:TIGR01212 family radical SAM protein [Paludibacteraceae bacterium]
MQEISDYRRYCQRVFGCRVQKISVTVGGTCPNRDGSKGTGGCIFCNNQSFTPPYCLKSDSVREQLDAGLRFFAHKPDYQKFIAYFQAYSNTYGPTGDWIRRYEEALAYPEIAGLAIGTRPDCLQDDLLDYLAEKARHTYILVELGVESTLDRTLEAINRGHSYADSAEAIRRCHERGLQTAAHLILGLPGESRDEMLAHADRISQLPVDLLKLHQLQIVRGTRLADEFAKNPGFVHLFGADEYIDLAISFVERLRPDITVERLVSQSPAQWRIAPDWQLKNYEFTEKFRRRMRERQTWQGRLFHFNDN